MCVFVCVAFSYKFLSIFFHFLHCNHREHGLSEVYLAKQNRTFRILRPVSLINHN